MGWSNGMTSATQQLHQLTKNIELCAISLHRSIQTALFNAPLVVIVGWIAGKDMDLNFEIFMIVLLVLSIVVVGNFLRDGESNYLEGALLVVSPGVICD